jgi:hypothetical protein
LFRVYRFFACWVYGFTAVGFFVLLTPFVRLWIGSDRILSTLAVFLMVADYYFRGDRIVLFNFKTAAGVFEPDKYMPLIQGAVSLILSLSLVHSMGVAGIFIGLLVSGLIANFVRPHIIYRVCFAMKATGYYLDWLKYLLVMIFTLLPSLAVGEFIMQELSLLTFIITAIAVTIIFNGTFIALFRKSEEFKYLWDMMKIKLRKS